VTFLIDAGLGAGVHKDVDRFGWFSRQAFQFKSKGSLAEVLAAAGGPSIDFVLLTHVHWDHTSGLTELPGVHVRLTAEDQRYVSEFSGAEPVVMQAHFKNVITRTMPWDGPPYENFPASHDLLGDGAVVVVPLPGHTPGAVGVFLNNVHGRRLFFVGDAVWQRDGFRIPSHRSRPISKRVDADPAAVSDTIWRLRHLQERHPDLIIVPAHDGEAYKDVVRIAGAEKPR
jgi:glyoxylase-like metal-dependent hydrolase (beta-lactamase superfamily II)